MTDRRMRLVCEVNPATPEFRAVAPGEQVTFVPLEAVWPFGRLDLTRTSSREAVASGYTRFKTGDVLLPKITPTFEAGRSAVASDVPTHVAAGTTELHVLRPHEGTEARFLCYHLHSKRFLSEGTAALQGVAGQKRITDRWVRDYSGWFPPLDEQRRIANFLDREIARIDRTIAEKQRLLDLLGERASAMDSVAIGCARSPVTGFAGPSGWLTGPAAASCVPLKLLAEVQTGLTLGKRYDGELEERPYLRVANVQAGAINTSTMATVAVPASVAPRYELRAGDVLMTEGGDFDKLGRGAVWDGRISGCLHQNHVFAVRPHLDRLLPEYLTLVTGSAYGRAYFTSTSTQSTNLASTNLRKVSELPVPLPTLDQQRRIIDGQRVAGQETRLLAEMVQQQVSLMQEHRRSLITEAVTGKHDLAAAPPQPVQTRLEEVPA